MSTPTAHATSSHDTSYRNPDDAFADAIRSGRLVDDPRSPRYAGHYMYMGTVTSHVLHRSQDLFKHIDTREYLP